MVPTVPTYQPPEFARGATRDDSGQEPLTPPGGTVSADERDRVGQRRRRGATARLVIDL